MNTPSICEGLFLPFIEGEGRGEEALLILECSSSGASPAPKSLFIRNAIHHDPRGLRKLLARAQREFAICHFLLAISAAVLPRCVHPLLPTP
jgi:hypothetical protein